MTDPSPRLPPPPAGNFMAWVMANPQQVAQYFAIVYAMQNAQLAITINGTTTKVPIRFSVENALFSIELPNRLSSAIADSSATAASVSTQLNLLLAAMRVTKQLPS